MPTVGIQEKETMSYTPNNVLVYTAAFTGAASGIMLNRKTTESTAPPFATLMLVSDAIAQAIDTIWAGTPSQLDVDNIQLQVQAQFAGGFPLKTSASFYAGLALTIIAIVTAAQVRYAAEGITPPVIPVPTPPAETFNGVLYVILSGDNPTHALSANDVKNATIHLDTTAVAGAAIVTFPIPATDADAYPRIVFHDDTSLLGHGLTIKYADDSASATLDVGVSTLVSFEPTQILSGVTGELT